MAMACQRLIRKMKTESTKAGKAQQLTKMQGAGNSFLILDADATPALSGSQLALKLCNRNFGIGADGLVILSKLDDQKLSWDFYNSDGSAAQFCGNAARCVAQYAWQKWDLSKTSLKTKAGDVVCEVLKDNYVRVQMPNPKWVEKEIKAPFWPKPVAWINTGVPHLVVEITSSKNLLNHPGEADQLRFWEELGSDGANVTFMCFEGDEKISAVTFERGVEDYTLACGTGAVAAAAYAMEKTGKKSFDVKMPGGLLRVFEENRKTFMEGPAVKIADIKINLGAIL